MSTGSFVNIMILYVNIWILHFVDPDVLKGLFN